MDSVYLKPATTAEGHPDSKDIRSFYIDLDPILGITRLEVVADIQPLPRNNFNDYSIYSTHLVICNYSTLTL